MSHDLLCACDTNERAHHQKTRLHLLSIACCRSGRRMGVFATVPRVGQGTWQIEADDKRRAIRALQRGFELGLTHVDTAEMYGDGRAEELVAEAIEGRRDEIFLVSKVLPQHASYDG